MREINSRVSITNMSDIVYERLLWQRRKRDEKMEPCWYSFCCASFIWKQSQTISTEPTRRVRGQFGKLMVYRVYARQLYSVHSPAFATAENIDGFSSDYGSSVSNLARRLAEERDKSRPSVSTSPVLESSSLYALDGEVSHVDFDSTCLVQDLELPDAPHKWSLPVRQVMTRMRIFLQQENMSAETRDQLDKDMIRLLVAVRGWIAQLADTARQLLASDSVALQQKQESQSVDALVTLLQMAGFAVLPELPEITEPPSPDALSLGNSVEKTLDPTIMQGSDAVKEHIGRNGVRLGSPSYYPHLFIATRGVTVVRNSGLLLPQKIRAIERTLVAWITSPFSFLLDSPPLKSFMAFSRGFGGKNSDDTSEVPTSTYHDKGAIGASAVLPPHQRKIVRRVVPAVKLTKTWDSFRKLFLPTLTQEPAHELMVLMYKEVITDKVMILRGQRKALINQFKESLSQAINPIPPGRKKAAQAAIEAHAFVFDGFQRPFGETKPVSLMMFANVPWGTTDHLFPSTFVLAATRDLLRIDALTFTGLVSALVTYLRSAENLIVYSSLIASVVSYFVRVVLGLRQALISYNGKIVAQKAESMMSQRRGCLDSLSELAAEEMFVDAACVWLSSQLSHQISARQLQQRIFQDASLTDEMVNLWEYWLHDNGF